MGWAGLAPRTLGAWPGRSCTTATAASASGRHSWLSRRSTCALAPYQSLDLGAHGLTEDAARAAVQWLDDSGQVAASGAPAIAESLAACGGGWALVGRFLRLPPVRPLAAVGYAVVARNRYRLPGSTDACRLD